MYSKELKCIALGVAMMIVGLAMVMALYSSCPTLTVSEFISFQIARIKSQDIPMSERIIGGIIGGGFGLFMYHLLRKK